MSGAAKDGGPAFPWVTKIGPRENDPIKGGSAGDMARQYIFSGMSLRDWFAGQALAGEIAGMDQTQALRCRDGETPEMAMKREARTRADWCYLQADAMIAARAVQP